MEALNLAARIYLSEEELLLRDTIRRFLNDNVVPLVPQMEAEGRPPEGLFRKMGELGLLGTFLPEEYGGSGGSLMTRAIVSEETARVNVGLDTSIFVNIALVARHLARYGTEEQKQRYLVPLIRGETSASICITEPTGGSDALSPRTVARKDGEHWIVKGHKTLITNAPIADCFLVFARTSGEDRRMRGGTCFIVDGRAKGLSVGTPFRKLSMRSSPTAEVFLEDVRVHQSMVLGEVDAGFSIMLDGLDIERALVGAVGVGMAQACLDICVPYARDRLVFGKPIGEYQMIQDKIARMAAGVEITRTMFYNLIRACERGAVVTREAAMMKLHATEMAAEVSREAVQVLGGYGLMESYQVARFYRDAKHHEIGAGTNEIQKIIIARQTMKSFGF